MPSPIGLGNFQAAYEPIAKKSFALGMGREVKERKEIYFDVVGSDKKIETYIELGDVGTVPEFNQELEYEEMQQGYQNTITNKVYGKGMRIEYEFIRTDQLRIAKSLPKMLGLAMRRRIGADASSWFNDATSAYLTRDGGSLVNSAHASGVSGGPTQSNRMTQAFGPVALAAARIAHQLILSNTGEILEIMPSLLIGSIYLQDAFKEVIKSEGQVGTANNTINVHEGSWTAINDKRIVDSNNWGIADKDLMKEYQVWQDVDPVDFKQAEHFDGRTAKYAVWAFYGFGSIGWEWFYFSEVS